MKNFTFNYDTIYNDKKVIAKEKFWPSAKVATVEPSGLLKIQFKQPMKVPDHRDFIQNDTITLNGTVYPIIAFEVVPGKYTDPLMTKFNWTYVDFTPQELSIQLNFEHLNYISATNGYPDIIKVTIYGI
jgi:hypothetical protein